MATFKFVTPVPPSVNSYLCWKVERRGRKLIPVSYHSPETVKYIAEATKIIKEAAKQQGWEQLDKDEWCKVTIKFFFPRKGNDPSNHNKVIFDVMTKCDIWFDDQFVILHEKDAFVDKDNPRLEVEVTTIDKMGVFLNSKQFEDFKTLNCEHCRGNGRKCSFLTQFLDNRAMEIDLETLTCKQKR